MAGEMVKEAWEQAQGGTGRDGVVPAQSTGHALPGSGACRQGTDGDRQPA